MVAIRTGLKKPQWPQWSQFNDTSALKVRLTATMFKPCTGLGVKPVTLAVKFPHVVVLPDNSLG